jgi:hypothetical protein
MSSLCNLPDVLEIASIKETMLGGKTIQGNYARRIVIDHQLNIPTMLKQELKTRPMYDCRYDERLEPKNDESTCLTYTGLLEELEYLKIETRLIDEKFASVMGECVN